MQNNTMEEIFFRRVMSITSESHYENDREREVFHQGFKEALGMVHIELFGTPKSQGFLKEQIHLAEQSLVQRVIDWRDELPVQDKDGTIDEYYNAQANACENIIRLLSTPKPKGDK